MKTKITIVACLILWITSCNQKNAISDNDLKTIKDSLNATKNISLVSTFYNKLIQSKNDSVNRNLLFKIADKFYDANHPDKYFEIQLKINELASLQKDSIHLAKSLNRIGYYYNIKTQLDSAFKYYLKSEKIYSALRDTINCGKIKMYKAGIYYDTGNFVESEIEAINALKQLIKTDNPRLIYQCYLTIALSLKELNNYSKSLEYFNLALTQIDVLEKIDTQKNTSSVLRANCFNNKGRIYEKEKKYREAINLYSKGLKVENLKKNDPTLYAIILSNMAYNKMLNGNLDGVKKMLFESYKIRDSLKSDSGMISSKFKIGEYYINQKDTVKALTYINDVYRLSKKIKSSQDIIKSLKMLTEIDPKNKNYYSKEYFRINDSLQVTERQTRNKFARIAYETDLVEKENQVLTKRNTYIMGIAAMVALFSIVFFIIYRLKSKNKELLLIKEQQEANEKIYQLMLNQQSENETARNEERNRIAMELHDGIVNSIFTTRFNLIQLEPNQTEKKQQLVEELENAEKEIRRVSHDLQQNLLFEDKNLPEIITNLVANQQNEFNTLFDFSADKHIDWSKVATNDKIHIYRIIQEAIQNINKYAKAEKGLVFLLKTGDKITIRIWDNGIGFKPEKVKQGIGLKNIKERVAALNGEVKIASDIGKGTTIEVVF